MHLSLISGVGPATITTIIAKIGFNDLQKVYGMRILDFCMLGIPLDCAVKIVQGLQDAALLQKELELIEKYINLKIKIYGDLFIVR